MKTAALKNLAVAACLALTASVVLADPAAPAAAPPPAAVPAAPSCDKIAADVREAIAKEPSKVLMIVEDAMVINESCACEIVTSAIIASSADQALANQIVATAEAVAPKMAAVIRDCAAAALSTQVASTTSGKSGAGKQGAGKEPAFSVQPPKEETVDYTHGGRVDIRGVYLTMPAAGGFVVAEDEEKSHDSKTYKRTVIVKERKTVIVPVSPTSPKPGDPKPGDPKK